eukprot:jgi/Ulvmu1/11611/UM008_0012.1
MNTHTILTTDASKRFSSLHDRMPVILPDRQACMDWITGTGQSMQEICKAYDGDDLLWHPVTRAMNKPSYKEADCSKPLKQGNIASFFTKQKRKSSDSKDSQVVTKKAKTEEADVKEEKVVVDVKETKVDNSYIQSTV